MKDNRKRFSVKDIIIIIICMIVLIVLLLLLKKTRENQQMEQEQLSQLQEQIQQGGNITDDENILSSSFNDGLVINEVNQTGWIELFNSAKKAINLKNLLLEIDGEQILDFKDEILIDSGERYVLELKCMIGMEPYNVIALKDINGAIVKAITVPQLADNESYGCVTDGSIQTDYLRASKNEANKEEDVIVSKGLKYSVQGGFYNSAFNLEITAPEGTTIYYTLDGSDPTTDSEKYTRPIKIDNRSGSGFVYAKNEMGQYKPSSIDMGTVVRAIAVDKKGKVVEEKTESYYIGLANNSDISNLPVISLTTDPSNLFDYYEGIYVKGRKHDDAVALGSSEAMAGNYYESWNKPAHIEYFEKGKDKTLEFDANISVIKDFSVTNSQKGFKVTSDTDEIYYGSTLEKYIDESGVFYIQTNKRDNFSKSREYLANELLKETSVGVAELMPCIVFVDGEYWGLYTIRQPFDTDYFIDHYGIMEEKVIVWQNGYMNNGDYKDEYTLFEQYITGTDMSVSANYEHAKTLMDMQSYIDYFCANMYLANADYGVEEACVWKTVQKGSSEYADGRWRWIVGKLDNAMGCRTESELTSATIDSFLTAGVRGDRLFRSLLRNSEFKEQVKKSMLNLADNFFTMDTVTAELETINKSISKAVASSHERFSASTSNSFYAEQVASIQEFFMIRSEYILQYTEELDELENRWSEVESNTDITDADTIDTQDTNTEENIGNMIEESSDNHE